jgi:hypothetical protein
MARADGGEHESLQSWSTTVGIRMLEYNCIRNTLVLYPGITE